MLSEYFLNLENMANKIIPQKGKIEHPEFHDFFVDELPLPGRNTPGESLAKNEESGDE